MKLLKLSLLAVLMTFAMMSCKNDTTSPIEDDEEFTIITEEQPLNIIIKTYNDDVLIDSVRIYVDNSMLVPKGYLYNSSFITNGNSLNLRFFTYPSEKFDLALLFENDSFKKGNYTLSPGSTEYFNYYVNPLLTSRYEVESGDLLINKVKHFKDETDQYFISWESNIIFKKQENDSHTTSVKVIFENLETFVGGV